MGSTHTTAQATSPDGQHVVVQQTATDSPLLPAANLRQLAEIDPKLVDWVVQQTEKEADFRRGENRRVNSMLFTERLVAVAAASILTVFGLAACIYLAMNGHDGVAATIAATTIVGVVTAVITGRTPKEPKQAEPRAQNKPARKRGPK